MTRILWIIILVFLSISAFYGGLSLIIDPSGELLQLPTETLEDIPFGSFLLPGLILSTVLGIIPALTAYGLITRRTFRILSALRIHKDMHWTWDFSLYIGFGQLIWIFTQVTWIGYGHPIQAIYACVGVIILIITLLPGNINSSRL